VRVVPVEGLITLVADTSTRVVSVYIPGDGALLKQVFIGTDLVWQSHAWGGENVCSPGVALTILVERCPSHVEVEFDGQMTLTLGRELK